LIRQALHVDYQQSTMTTLIAIFSGIILPEKGIYKIALKRGAGA
jgi:hypothetical protein